MKNKAIVKIMGKNYTVCAEQETPYLLQMGGLVAEYTQALQVTYPTASTTDIAVMTALSMADEVNELRKQNHLLRQVQAKVQSAQTGESVNVNAKPKARA